MALSKRGYTTQTGYTISKRKYNELKRAISTYNKRIARLEAKYTTEVAANLPQRRRVTEERDKLTSTKDVNQLIKELESYREKGLELTEYQGILLTKAEKDIFERRIKQENKKREERRAEIKARREAKTRFPVQEERSQAPISTDVKSIEALRTKLERTRQYQNVQRINTWRANYLSVVEEERNKAILEGKINKDMSAAFNRIKHIVSTISAPAFYWANILEPDIILQRWYTIEELEAYLETALGIWERYYENQGDYE